MTSNMKVVELQGLWEIHKNDVVPDALIPPLPVEAQVPDIDDTKLGHVNRQKI